MARIEDNEYLYETFHNFAQACFIEDRSYLWPDRSLWTLDNIWALKHRIIDTPDAGEEHFIERIASQMAGQPVNLWGLLADIYYLFCLIPSSRKMKPATKRLGVIGFAQNSRFPIPEETSESGKAWSYGFCTPGRRYMQKYRQFWHILMVAEQSNRVQIAWRF